MVTLERDRWPGRCFAIHRARRGLKPADFDIEQWAAQNDGFSSAEIEQAVVAARDAAQACDGAVDNGLLRAHLAGTPPL